MSASLDEKVREVCLSARKAARKLAPRSTEDKNAALEAIAAGLETNAGPTLAANKEDLETARAKGQTAALLDRLMLDEARLAGIAKSVREIAGLADPVGGVIARAERPSGIRVTRVRVPLGVIAMIY